MTKYKLIITSEAYKDILEISEFISQYNERAAKDTIQFLFGACNNLLRFPSLGVKKEAIKSEDVKIYIVRQYLIAYKIDDKNIVILKISNQYQNIYPNI